MRSSCLGAAENLEDRGAGAATSLTSRPSCSLLRSQSQSLSQSLSQSQSGSQSQSQSMIFVRQSFALPVVREAPGPWIGALDVRDRRALTIRGRVSRMAFDTSVNGQNV